MLEIATFTLPEAAVHAGVHRRTVRHWIRTGRLPATQTPSGHWRVARADLDAMPLTTGQLARAVGVSPRTVQAWITSGKLPAERDRQGRYMVAAEWVDRIGRRHQEVGQAATGSGR